MKWLIFFTMAIADPFVLTSPLLHFESRNECVDYVNDPSNASTLAIEVIGHAGFNDTILQVGCMSEDKVKEIPDPTIDT